MAVESVSSDYLFADRPRRRRTSASETFERIRLSRAKLYLPILEILAHRGSVLSQCLTAREILRALKERGDLSPGAERNSVSPRLTELLDASCIENPEFIKHVPGDAPASVWLITPRGRLLLEHLRSQQNAGGPR